jgi:hypothetical protein
MAWRVDSFLMFASDLPRGDARRQADVLSERYIAWDAWINIVLIVGTLLAVGYVLVFAPLAPGPRLLIASTGLIGGIALVKVYDNERMRSRIKRHLEDRLCFRCGYAMTDLPCAGDCRIRCPECGHVSPSRLAARPSAEDAGAKARHPPDS